MDGLSPQFVATIAGTFKEDGRAWLRDLPRLLDACARRWSLTLAEPFPNLSYHYVAPALRADGAEVVLKAGVPNPEIAAQAAALTGYGGGGGGRRPAARGPGEIERLLPQPRGRAVVVLGERHRGLGDRVRARGPAAAR